MFHLNQTEKDELVTNWHRFASLKHSSSLPYEIMFTSKINRMVYQLYGLTDKEVAIVENFR